MNLLVAYRDDPAGYNMAAHLSKDMRFDGGLYRGRGYDLLVIPTPAVSADWLSSSYDYDGFIFLSKHAAKSGDLALTCHSTGNFSDALLGGNARQVAIPHPHFQKAYLRELSKRSREFDSFEITIEATHHGPTALDRPTIFVEVGTTERQWNDEALCARVASVIHDVVSGPIPEHPVAVCMGGTHYSSKFTNMILEGRYALGTVIPRHALEHLDEGIFSHILERNRGARVILVDMKGLGAHRRRSLDLAESSGLEVICA